VPSIKPTKLTSIEYIIVIIINLISMVRCPSVVSVCGCNCCSRDIKRICCARNRILIYAPFGRIYCILCTLHCRIPWHQAMRAHIVCGVRNGFICLTFCALPMNLITLLLITGTLSCGLLNRGCNELLGKYIKRRKNV